MNFEQFKHSLSSEEPPDGLSIYLQAMWYDGKGDWAKAHTIIQDSEDARASLIHAYLHRKEGDLGNADYWYRRAGKKNVNQDLYDEWETIVKSMINY